MEMTVLKKMRIRRGRLAGGHGYRSRICRWPRRLGVLTKQAASHPQRPSRLLNVDRLGQRQIRADTICIRDSHLPFRQSDDKRISIEAGTAGAPKKQCGVLDVVAIEDDGIVMLRYQPIHRLEGFRNRLDHEADFTKNQTYYAGDFLVGTKKNCGVAHDEVIVVTDVGYGKLRGYVGHTLLKGAAIGPFVSMLGKIH